MVYLSTVYWDKVRRCNNEDTVVLQEVSIGNKKAILAAVCDGIGGLEQGEVASGLVGEYLIGWFYLELIYLVSKNKSIKKIKKSGLRILYTSQEALCRYAKEVGHKLGTTATILFLWNNKYIIWHVGDSRIYKIKPKQGKNCVQALTQNHVQGKTCLTKCIGSFLWQKPDVSYGTIKKGEVLLLCSDGYYNHIEPNRLWDAFSAETMVSEAQIYRRVKELAQYAIRKGETDNMSAIVIKR